MVDIVDRIGILKRPRKSQIPTMIVLHDTVSPTTRSAENGLNSRDGLGYHFIIAKDGTITQYADVNEMMYHAAGWNRNTIGISYVCGGKYGEVNEAQLQASLDLITDYLLDACPKLNKITCHKNVSNSGKSDPRWPGQPEKDWSSYIDLPYMRLMSENTGLTYFTNGKER